MQSDWIGPDDYPVELIRSIDETFGAHARRRREVMRLSQGMVALIMDAEYGIKWHQTVLSKIEAGERAVKLNEAYALANTYLIPLHDLVLGTRLDQHTEEAWTIRPGHGAGLAQYIEEQERKDQELRDKRTWFRYRKAHNGEHPEEA